MAVLHNRVSQKELKQLASRETQLRQTISFYHYFAIADPQAFRDELYKALNELKVLGRIYIAHEGINAQLSVPKTHFKELQTYLYSIPPLNGVRLNISVNEDDNASPHPDIDKTENQVMEQPFWVLKIKVREKIVADGIDDPTFSMEEKGKYVTAEEFNKLTDEFETIVVDMRNHYEYEVGHFEKALEIPSDTFREHLPMAADMLEEARDKHIIMYCTGGIRCEKASAYMLHRGFKNVYHLEGGIIHYANEVKKKGMTSKFHGKNFVFDNRLGERITDEVISSCHQCGKPADTHINCANEGCHLLFIQCDECRTKRDGCCSLTCQQIIHLPLELQKQMRKGMDKGQNIFNKSRKQLRRLNKDKNEANLNP